MVQDQILEKVRLGCPVILLDDRKEAEGDIFCPAEKATPEVLQFMIRQGSGLLCMSLPRTRLEQIGIPRISEAIEIMGNLLFWKGEEGLEGNPVLPPTPGFNSGTGPAHWKKFLKSLIGRVADTPFHFPLDLAGHESGISVVERLETIQALLAPDADIDDFATPGHLFTLGAHPKGLAGRWGHTEASVDLCRAAGLTPAGLLCEIVGDDGTMLRGDDLTRFAEESHVDIFSLTAIPDLLNRIPVGIGEYS